MTNVLAFNGSPKLEKSNTTLILTPFLEGMTDAGAKVELFYTRRLSINPCTGEYHCWISHPGKCYQDDDMNMLYPKIQAADILVFATPLYVDGMSGPMKTLFDRMIPLVQPFFELREGHCRHPLQSGTRPGKTVLVSNCGFWELDNFDPLLTHVQAACRNMDRDFAGALLRPHGPAFKTMLRMGQPVDDVLTAAKTAGRQLVETGTIAPETLNVVRRELLPRERYLEEVNRGFQRARERAESSKKAPDA
jgi:multimeric flavodoxin WrbA